MASIEVQTEMLCNRLAKRRRHLDKWAKRTGIDAYRLYDRDIPEIPLLIDWYSGALSLSLYERPYEKDDTEEAAWLSAMKEAASKVLQIPEEMIFCRERKRLRGRASTGKRENTGAETQYGRIGDKCFERIVHEGALLYKVNLSDYLDTGLFLDRRKIRSLIREEAAGKRVLNLFCYTGSFSICAAAGGAAEIDSVDLSAVYLEWARSNFRLNGLISAKHRDTEAERFRFIRADVLKFLENAQKTKLRWDLIILDPPAFSNSKKMAGTLDIQRDHGELLVRCMGLLKPKGTLYFCAGTRRFRLDCGVDSGKSAGFPGVEIQDLRAFAADEDFPQNRAPFCYRFRKTS
jgi:23S rRNA G2069 N7-methylase RlmK/C1962 C5-methylase RlmI